MPETTASSAAAPPPTPGPRRGKLLQVLGVSFGIAVIIGNTILVGILRTPGDVAARLPRPRALHRRLDPRRPLCPARDDLPGRAGRDGGPVGRAIRHRAPRTRRLP